MAHPFGFLRKEELFLVKRGTIHLNKERVLVGLQRFTKAIFCKDSLDLHCKGDSNLVDPNIWGRKLLS